LFEKTSMLDQNVYEGNHGSGATTALVGAMGIGKSTGLHRRLRDLLPKCCPSLHQLPELIRSAPPGKGCPLLVCG